MLFEEYINRLVLRGFEDEESETEESNEGPPEPEEPPAPEVDKEDVSGLKAALEAERRERKEAAKELKQLKKFKEEFESKDKTESDKAKEAQARAEEKATKLASRLRNQAIDFAINKMAQKAKFRDVDDAISLIKRDAIEVDQDEDDPSDITVDEKSVEKAVTELAKNKPHLIIAEGDSNPSGSKFGGKGKGDKEMTEQQLANKYPALAATVRLGEQDR